MDYTENTKIGERVAKRNTGEPWEKHFKQFTRGLYELWNSYKCKEQLFSEILRIRNEDVFSFFNQNVIYF